MMVELKSLCGTTEPLVFIDRCMSMVYRSSSMSISERQVQRCLNKFSNEQMTTTLGFLRQPVSICFKKGFFVDW